MLNPTREERSSLGHCRDFSHVKRPPTHARFGQSDGHVAHPASQHLLRGTYRSPGYHFSIPTTSVYCQGQCVVVPQFDSQLGLRTPYNVDAAVGPSITGLYAAPWRTPKAGASPGVHVQRS